MFFVYIRNYTFTYPTSFFCVAPINIGRLLKNTTNKLSENVNLNQITVMALKCCVGIVFLEFEGSKLPLTQLTWKLLDCE